MQKSAAQRCESWRKENRACANDRKEERTRTRVRGRFRVEDGERKEKTGGNAGRLITCIFN